MKIFCICCLALAGLASQAQGVSSRDIIGRWKVVNVTIAAVETPDGSAQDVGPIKKAYLTSMFRFNADKHFSFDIDYQKMKIHDAHWKYDDKTKEYIIQDWKDKDTDKAVLMKLSTKKEGDKILFLISESPVLLEVKKDG
jgi:hypothetical protein